MVNYRVHRTANVFAVHSFANIEQYEQLNVCEQCEQFTLNEPSERRAVNFLKTFAQGEQCEQLFVGPWSIIDYNL